MATSEELQQFRAEMNAQLQAMSNKYNTDLQLIEAKYAENLKLLRQEFWDREYNLRKLKKYRDLFIMKKNFPSVPNFDGKPEKYDDWHFTVRTFLELEEHFASLLDWTEKQTKMPMDDDLETWETHRKASSQDEDIDVEMMNMQVYNFLCLNLRGDALTIVKKMKGKEANGIGLWWKFNHDCQALTGQRIQALANAIYKPTRVKKYMDVATALERWERDIRRFEEATKNPIGEETKLFSLRQLVPDELDQLITANSNSLTDYEKTKAYVEEQISIRRDRKSNGPVPMEVDQLADKVLAAAAAMSGEDGDWEWGEEDQQGCGNGVCDKESGINNIMVKEDMDNNDKIKEKLENIMSFIGNFKGGGKGGKSKGKGGKGKADKSNVQCWHCGKFGHYSGECWQKDAEMEAYRTSKGKGKGSGKNNFNGYGGYGKGDGGKGGKQKGGKGKGNWWYNGKGSGAYCWFDQPAQEQQEQHHVSSQSWAFSLLPTAISSTTPSSTATTTSIPTSRSSSYSTRGAAPAGDGKFELPKKSAKGSFTAPPGLAPSILSPTTWEVFKEEEQDCDDHGHEALDMPPPLVDHTLDFIENDLEMQTKPDKHPKLKMPRVSFQTESQKKKKARSEAKVLNKSNKNNTKQIEDNNEIMKKNSELLMQLDSEKCGLCRPGRVKRGDAEDAFIFIPAQATEEVNMVKGWRKEENGGWIKVRSVMDSGCGKSVAPPGMCPWHPIVESEGSKRGQEFVSASEDVLPNLGEQHLEVVMPNGRETAVNYQMADVSRALNSISEICDAGHPDFGHHVVFGRHGGMVVNLETGMTTPFERDVNIYCMDFWVKPFTRQGN